MLKILIVEDEGDLREEIGGILKYENFEVIEASNGEDGIKMAKAQNPDLILCDILMPDVDGFEVLKQLHENDATTLTPFIFITSRGERSNLRKGMGMGADDYLVKPFTRAELLKTIKTRLEKSSEIQKQVTRFKDNIINTIPHEMRTPLNAIIGFSKIMKDEAGVLSEKEVADMAGYIYKSGNRLFGIIKKFLMFIDIEMNNERITFDTIYITQKYIEEFAGEIAEKYNRNDDLIIEFQDFKLTGSEEWFYFALGELIDNAFKFSAPGQMVIIKAKKNEKKAMLSISDKGMGFPPGSSDRINAFKQFNRKAMEQQGIGLGLFLARQIVIKHGGELQIDPLVKNGSIVRLTFPVHRETDLTRVKQIGTFVSFFLC